MTENHMYLQGSPFVIQQASRNGQKGKGYYFQTASLGMHRNTVVL